MKFYSVLRRIRVAFVVAGIAVVVFGAASFVTIQRLVDFGQAQMAGHAKLQLLEDLDRSLIRTQVALRDYLLSGARDDLDWFHTNATKQTEAMERLGRTPRGPEHKELKELVNRRTLGQYRIAATREKDGLPAALQGLASVPVKQSDARLSDLIQQARALEEEHIHAEPAAAWAQYVVAGGVVLLLALFGSGAWIVRRYERERVRVVRQLDETETVNRSLAANMADGLIRFSPDLQVIQINRVALQMLGYEESELVGRPVTGLVADYPGRAAFYRALTVRLARPESFQVSVVDVTAARKDGRHLPVQVSLNDVHIQGKRCVTALFRDMSSIKRIDRMKTEFISTVSHELRTPLTSIRGSLGLVSGGVLGKLPDAVANLLGIAQNNCDRLIRLINDILDIEKIESGKLPLRLELVDLAALARKCIDANQGFAQQHEVLLCLHDAAEPLITQADNDRLLQVLTNLLSNAVKFSPPAGVVDVRLSGSAGRVRVEVADSGPGIPLEFQQQIFQKFSQADSSDTRNKSGTGLGLNISRTLVEKMGGEIGFHSTPGRGAVFFFELPRHREPVATSAALPAAVAEPTRRVRILHVDPDGDIRSVVSHLAGQQATCISAGSLRHARECLRETRFDLVLLEPRLEDGCGWDLLADIERLEDGAPPVLVFSVEDTQPPAGHRVAAVLVKSQTSEPSLVGAIRRAVSMSVDTTPEPLAPDI